ncbi:MAG: N-acetylneuraminate synthase family protein [Magnetovibrio sp.]|nr:N-acetylneuraminate synthase family protein [Magnetovibrio sp.]
MADSIFTDQNLLQINPWPIPKYVYVIGEIGINHNGDLEVAKKLINMAKTSGCDAVKFQKRTIDIVYPQDVLDAPRESPWGTTQREQKEGLEFDEADFDELDAYCKNVDIDWFASAWDVPSQIFLRKYDAPYNKVASAMALHTELLEAIAQEKKTTFLSVGMCTYEDIDNAVAIFKKHDCQFVLLHTVSEYPAPEKALNLRGIVDLREKYGVPVGYSGHEPSVSPSIMAAMMGAVAVERHITLDRAMYGSDQAASLEGPGLQSMIAQIRKIPEVLGTGERLITEGEKAVAHKLRYWKTSGD